MSTQAERFNKASEPKSTDLKGLVKELFEILDTTEVSDNGNRFRPVEINSCRVLLTAKLGKLLPRMKELANAD